MADRRGSGLLIVRAWLEPGTDRPLRVRITQGVDSGEVQVATASSVDGLTAATAAWLEELMT